MCIYRNREKENDFYHASVLKKEALDFLNCKKGGTYIDATAGGGGYAAEILKRVGPKGCVVCLDRDEWAVAAAEKRLNRIWHEERKKGPKNFMVKKRNFAQMKETLAEAGLKKVDGVVFDLGLSSPQLDQPERGFSFDREGPLDMRMDREQKITAERLVNQARPAELLRIIRQFGEERLARPIVRAIERARQSGPIRTTTELAQVIKRVLARKNAASCAQTLARVFQALRIAVNDELENLRSGLAAAAQLLAPGGRLVAVSFHSLEDRIVKNFFRDKARPCVCPPQFPVCCCDRQAELKILTKKPVRARAAEIARNPRARSGKLRAAARLGG